jgi:hypothetical protein
VADFMSYYTSQRPIPCLYKQNQTHSKRHSNPLHYTVTEIRHVFSISVALKLANRN